MPPFLLPDLQCVDAKVATGFATNSKSVAQPPSTGYMAPMGHPAHIHTAQLETLLAEGGLVKPDDLAQAKRLQAESGSTLDQALLRYGAISEDALLTVRADQLGLGLATAIPSDMQIFQSGRTALGLSESWLHAHHCAVWMEDGQIAAIAKDILDPALRETLDKAAYRAGLDIDYRLSTTPVLESALAAFRLPSSDAENLDDAARLRELAEEAPVIDFVNRIFSHALKHRASDIHIEPFENNFRVRYRIDGVLRDGPTEPRSRFDAVVSRIKLLSKMDIAERRLPQDGRQTIRFAGSEIDLRVSSLPGSWGESLVLRLLKKDNTLPDLGALGLGGRNEATLQRLLSHPNGVLLVTGPTGSGKSTTLYRSLQGLNNGVRKIITIEDPVEYDMSGVVQIPINAGIGYTFARGLRAILRQDPDIIMVGEIRDEETATIAAQAALTGHLVLSTLHTNSALAGVARLVDIGLEPYMVASAVRGFAAQRLVRRLCESCAVPDTDRAGEDLVFDLVKSGSPLGDQITGAANFRRAVGCADCDGTGYTGRTALFEIAEVSEALGAAIFESANLQTLTRIAREDGFTSLLDDGMIKARQGQTSLEEILRVCGADVPTPRR